MCCYVHVLQDCLWVCPALVPVCCLTFSLFAGIACCYWGLNVLIYTLCVLPPSLTSLAPLHQILCFGCFFFVREVYAPPTMAHLWLTLPLSRSPTLADSPPHSFEPQNIKHIATITTLTHFSMHVMFCHVLLHDT